MALIRIPQRFYNDHCERDLPTPAVHKATRSHYWIDSQDPALSELYADADFYNDPSHFGDPQLFGLVMSARATQEAIERAVPGINTKA